MQPSAVPGLRLALGTWSLAGEGGIPGYGRADRATGEETIRAALAAGVTLLDTADVYGDGDSEKLVGQACQGMPGVEICTKGGWNLETNTFDPDPDRIRTRFFASRERLQRDVIDVYLLHGPPAHLIGVREIYEPLVKLQRAGAVRRIGVSVPCQESAWATLERPEVEVVQLPYNFLLWQADCGLLQRLRDAGKLVLAREVLGNGLLSGKYRSVDDFAADDFRSRWTPELIDLAVSAMRAWDRYRLRGESWVDFALRFALNRSEFSAVIVGARNSAQLRPLVDAARRISRAAPRPSGVQDVRGS